MLCYVFFWIVTFRIATLKDCKVKYFTWKKSYFWRVKVWEKNSFSTWNAVLEHLIPSPPPPFLGLVGSHLPVKILPTGLRTSSLNTVIKKLFFIRVCELKFWAYEGTEKYAFWTWHSQDVELMWKEKISVRFEMKRSYSPVVIPR